MEAVDPDKVFSVAETNVRLSHEDVRLQLRQDLSFLITAAVEEGIDYKSISNMIKNEAYKASYYKYGSASRAAKELQVNRGTFRKWKEL